METLSKVARPAGFEPTTPWFVAKYSNPTELRARCNCKKRIMRYMAAYCKWFLLRILKNVGELRQGPDFASLSVETVVQRQRELLHIRLG